MSKKRKPKWHAAHAPHAPHVAHVAHIAHIAHVAHAANIFSKIPTMLHVQCPCGVVTARSFA